MNNIPFNKKPEELKVQIYGNDTSNPLITTNSGQLVTTLYDASGNAIGSVNNDQLKVTWYDASGNTIQTANNGQVKTTIYKSDGTELAIENNGEVKATLYTATGQAIATANTNQVVTTIKSSTGTEAGIESSGELKTSLYADKSGTPTKVELDTDNRLKVSTSNSVDNVIANQSMAISASYAEVTNTSYDVSALTMYTYFIKIANSSGSTATVSIRLEISPDNSTWLDSTVEETNISVADSSDTMIMLVNKYYGKYVRLAYISDGAITISGFLQGL